MQVVEREHDRLVARERLEQPADGTVRAVALVLQPVSGRAAGRLERREHVGELRHRLLVEVRDRLRSEPVDVLVERVDEDPERQLALQLGRAAGEHDVAQRLGALAELAEQARLADPRLAHERERAGASAREVVEHVGHDLELCGPPDQLLDRLRHLGVPSSRA